MIKVYTDGSCKPTNPGYGGSGFVVIKDDTMIAAESKYLNKSTNNIAELSAIDHALNYLLEQKLKQESIIIYSDSQYSIGIFSKGWKAKANIELIQSIKNKLKDFPSLTFEWVKAHNGDQYNEMADELANSIVDANIKN